MRCAECNNKDCYGGKDCSNVKEQSIESYKNNSGLLRMADVSTYLEANFYMKLTRLEELIVFCNKMDYRRLGIAFCIGLSAEAQSLVQVLKQYFETYSVCCKVCGIEKEKFKFDKIDDSRFEAMCNPAGQAIALNNLKTDLNIIFGLCIGHDIIFSNISDAPTTTLLVKDRVLAHNPVGALNSGYYRKNIAKRIEEITGLKPNDDNK
jgi:uncharacterized metal-binding protein